MSTDGTNGILSRHHGLERFLQRQKTFSAIWFCSGFFFRKINGTDWRLRRGRSPNDFNFDVGEADGTFGGKPADSIGALFDNQGFSTLARNQQHQNMEGIFNTKKRALQKNTHRPNRQVRRCPRQNRKTERIAADEG